MSTGKPGFRPLWRVGIDTGGTFTDAIALDPDGRLRRAKVLSSSVIRARATPGKPPGSLQLAIQGVHPPAGLFEGVTCRFPDMNLETRVLDHPEPCSITIDPVRPIPDGSLVELRMPHGAPRLALHLLMQLGPGRAFPPMEVRVATTRATNALLEGRGDDFALVVDHGLEDLILIGDQTRPDLFALRIDRPRLTPSITHGVRCRLDREGIPSEPPAPDELDRIAESIRESGAAATGIALLHAFRNPGHEAGMAEALRARGVPNVIAASTLSGSEGLTPRTETLAVEASVRSVMRRFIEDILPEDRSENSRVLVMNSSGGLTREDAFLAKDGLLSGPAGGVVGAADAAGRLGLTRLLGFDMGGTSTDVSRYDGEMLYRFETRVGPARVQAPCIAIETVAAGGGSICSWGSRGLEVGPRSAGSDPGPACYGAGGPLTLTDVNLLMGRADPASFGIPIDLAASWSALETLAGEIAEDGSTPPDPDDLLEGLLEIANERMAQAMQAVSVREGADPAEHTLVPFGGAGGQHACAIAERLGIRRIFLPTDAGILSARGTLIARDEQFAERTLNQTLAEFLLRFGALNRELTVEACKALGDDRAPDTLTIIGVRLQGQDDVIQLVIDESSEPAKEFAGSFERIYGYPPPDREVEVAWMRVRATAPATGELPREPEPGPTPPAPGSTAMQVSGRRIEIPVLRRSGLVHDQEIRGPLVLVDDGATTVLDPGWRATVQEDRSLLCTRDQHDPKAVPAAGSAETAARELVAARLESIAVAMGRLLQRTALSINVRQRLDFSCALLDEHGRLLVNAPHMPIHLGSMGLCVRRSIEFLRPGPGDVLVTNHPACGGSHLPDVTTIAPVHSDRDGTCLGFVAVRAHHAEIGGTRPGSTPPFAGRLLEEGVVIPPTLLVEDGTERFDEVERMLREAPWPSRRPEENIADLRAQLAATRYGIARIGELAGELEDACYLERAKQVRVNATRVATRAIESLGDFDRSVRQELDDGAVIALRARTAEGRLHIDFTGSHGVHPGNFNAPVAIVTGACVYLMRLLAGEGVPMNEGLLDPIDLVVPAGMLNPDFTGPIEEHPAVCAGNTETSQRITDTLLLAFDLAACSQGTMNNLLFGDSRFGYYETIAGGAGATRLGPGCSAVHTHMTNTRITDPEVLESRFPVQLDRFRIRRGSGGTGRFRGGDGVVRSIRARDRLDVSFVSQHRESGPYGLHGGNPGAAGLQYHLAADGTRLPLAACDQVTLEPGEAIWIETPGGGAWGGE